MQMTAEDLELLLYEAADTLRRLRVTSHEPKPPRSNWPVPLQDYWASYGRHAPKVRLSPPDADAIDRMDLFTIWLLALMREAQRPKEDPSLWVRVLMARASGHSFQRIADMASHVFSRPCSKSTASRIYADCLSRLTRIANRSLAA